MKKVLILAIVTLLAVCASYYLFDRQIALFFHEHHLPLFKFVTSTGNAALWIVGSLLIFLFYRKKKPWIAQKALYLFSSIFISGILTDILKILIGRPRPKVWFAHHLYNPQFLEFKASFWSMPSGHTTTAFAAATALGLLWPKYRYLLFFWAFLVGLSRIVLTKHFLSDTLLGALIGILTAIVLYPRFFKEKDA